MQINTNPYLMKGPSALDHTVAAASATSVGKNLKTAENGWKTMEKGLEDVIGVNGEMSIPEKALRKDDPLGNLVARAFGI